MPLMDMFPPNMILIMEVPLLKELVGFSDERFGVRLAGRLADKDGYSFNTLTNEDEGESEGNSSACKSCFCCK